MFYFQFYTFGNNKQSIWDDTIRFAILLIMKGKIVIPNLHQEEMTLNHNKKINKTKLASKKTNTLLVIILLALLVVGLTFYVAEFIKQSNIEVNLPIPPQAKQQVIEQKYQTKNQVIEKSTNLVKVTIYQTEIFPKDKEDNFVFTYTQRVVNDNSLFSFLKKRINIFQNHLSAYKKLSQHVLKSQIGTSKITKNQFSKAIQLISYSPLILNNSQRISNAVTYQQDYYESKYNISSYNELQFCVVVPTYKNAIKYRYFINLYTLLQQNYTNYHVVIIDDASEDHTADKIQQQLNRNLFAKSKVTLIKNQKRVFHMANIYHAVYNYCKAGQVLAIIDGDDELVGRQVFKLINAAYHRTKAFSIYTNHIESKKDVSLQIGISKQYPQQIIQKNSFRWTKHYYSHLKTAWVDFFLQIKEQSLQTKDGKWYNNAVDNAIFLSIFEMSCGRVQYLPQITYKYNTYTGNSIANMDYNFRKATADQIKNKQQYKCIKQTRPEIYEKIMSYTQ